MRLDYLVAESDHQRRAGRIAAEKFSLSQRDLTYLKQTNGLLANGRPIRQIDRVNAGILLSVILPDSKIPESVYCNYLIYADEAIQVIDKPAGLPTMASSVAGGRSLESICTEIYGSFRPVNRLDKGTGGLMVCATTGHFQHSLSTQLHTDRFIREYIAVVEGTVTPQTGLIDLPIGHSGKSANLRQIDLAGKPAQTYYYTLSHGSGRTMLRLRLITGRTHQIRVHLAAIGHPICGDYLYGSALDSFSGSFALHSTYLFLRHPLTGETLFFRSPPPASFQALLRP